MTDYAAIIPLLIVALAGAAAMLAEAFRQPGERMPIAAVGLLVIFIALEILSLAVYVLTGLRRASVTSAEAAFKYFLLGSFSSAFFLYGIAFLFAVAGSTRLEQISVALSAAGASGPPTLAI